MNPSTKIDIERIARAARIYVYNYVAAQVLAIHPVTFSRLCRENGIESPYARRRRLVRERKDHPYA